jgi:hypothetical protein
LRKLQGVTTPVGLFTVVAFVGVSLLVFPGQNHGAGLDRTMEGFLPSPGFSEGWVMEDRPKTYTKDNLYTYIDGEAEFYFPYGFELVISVAYIRVANPKDALVADIYRMGSLLDAFGVYSYYRDPEAEGLRIGAEGFVDESQLMFYKDRYFVRLSASGSGNPDRKILVGCGEAIAKRLPGESTPPKELELLSIPEVIPRTEQYTAQSLLGHAFFRKGLTADAVLGNETIKLFVVLDESAKGSGEALERYIKYLKETGVEPRTSRDPRGVTLITQDRLYRGVIVRQSGRYLLGAAKLKDPGEGVQVIDRLQSRITMP